MLSLPDASVEANGAADGRRSRGPPSQGDTCQNGSAPQLPDPPPALGPTTSPMGPAVPPGVAGFHDNLRKSQGPSAEGSVRKEALQSLRLSLPMQETQLCKHPFPRLFPSLSQPPPESLPLPTPQAGTLTSSLLVPLPVFCCWWTVCLSESSISQRTPCCVVLGWPCRAGLCASSHLGGEEAAVGN